MAPPDRPRVVRGENDLFWAEDGSRYIDLFSMHGATWLGHAHPVITRRVAAELERIWLTGGLDSVTASEARGAIERFFPPSHAVAALYSTGMEAAEFALRVARHTTGKAGAIGFERSMHGKSVATAALAWDNGDGVELPGFHRVPFVPACPEPEILERVEKLLRTQPISAVFVEPIQGSGGGHAASPGFYRDVAMLCREHGALLVFDEILTGFHRTGRPFFFSDLGFVPDVVLIGKAMGNGFPVSGVVVDRAHAISRAMLPGSTYAGSPLAAAAVVATLDVMRSMDLPAIVAGIDRTLEDMLGGLRARGIASRGTGALRVLELPPGIDGDRVVLDIYRAGVAVGHTKGQVRILPPATITTEHLRTACAIVAERLGQVTSG